MKNSYTFPQALLRISTHLHVSDHLISSVFMHLSIQPQHYQNGFNLRTDFTGKITAFSQIKLFLDQF